MFKKIVFLVMLSFLSFVNAAESGYERSQKVYLDTCSECHGSDGEKLELGINSFENIIKDERLTSVFNTLHSSVLQENNQKLYSADIIEKLKNLKITPTDEMSISYYIMDEFKAFSFFKWFIYAVLISLVVISISGSEKVKQLSSVVVEKNNEAAIITKVTCTGTSLNIYINKKQNPTYMIGGCSEIKNWNKDSVTYRSISSNGKLIITVGINGKETGRYYEK